MYSRRGFTLFESLITISLSAMVIAGLLLYFISLARASIPRTISGLRLAPSLGALRDAALLNQVLAQRIAESKAVYVLGGSHRSIPGTATEAQQRPLSATALPNIPSFAPGLPPSSYAFYNLYQAHLGGVEASPDNSDFTLVVIGPGVAPIGSLQATCLVQVRRVEFQAEGDNWVRYAVDLYDLNENRSYAFATLAIQDSGLQLPVGATHTWLRYQAGVVAEEGPAVCVVPDPHLMHGALNLSGETLPVSRFVYFLQ